MGQFTTGLMAAAASLMALSVSLPAQAEIQSIYSINAQVTYDGVEAQEVFNVLVAAGVEPQSFTKIGEDSGPGDDPFLNLSSVGFSALVTTDGHWNSKDPCYQKPIYKMTFTYGHASPARLAGKTIILNADMKCTGVENSKAEAAYRAFKALDPDEDVAMGGRYGFEVKDVTCFTMKNRTPLCSTTIPKSVKLQ